jgi:pre-mRNA-splicing factor SPF27
MMSAPADGDFKKSVQNAKSHIEYQRSRMTTLELGIKFGNDQWRIHNFKMEKTIESLKRKNEEVNDQKNKIMNLRKQDQLHAKKTLDSLNSKAHELAPAIISVRLANEQIKKRTGQ